MPTGRPVALARSECESCHQRLRARDLVPLLSYAALRGRCRMCGAPIGTFHPAVELAACGVALWAMLANDAAFWANCALGWCLLTLGWIDVRSGRLPDLLTLPLLLAGLVATWLLNPSGLVDHTLGAAAGYAAFRLLAASYAALRGREGLGQGDAKLLAACGAWVGWAGLPSVVWLGALTGICLILVRKRVDGTAPSGEDSVPFGPCLALGAWIVRLHLTPVGG